MQRIADGMGRGRAPSLRRVDVGDNGALGSGGVAALAGALADCANLEHLGFCDCGVGGEGYEAVAAQVPLWPKLRELSAFDNPGPSDALGRALAAALTDLPDLEAVNLVQSGLSKAVASELRTAAVSAGRALQLGGWGER